MFLDVLVCMKFPNGIAEKCKKGKVKSFAQKSGVLISKYQKRSHKVGTPAGEAVRAPEAVQGNCAASYSTRPKLVILHVYSSFTCQLRPGYVRE